MGKGKRGKLHDRGSWNPQEINKKIEKRFEYGKLQEALMMSPDFISINGPVHSSAPTYSIASANPPTIVHGSSLATQGEKAARADQLPGYIFLCNGRTKPECFTYRVFGLPASRLEVVEKIKPTTKLFLFDFDLKLLYGVYTAASSGTMALEPTAFGGRFPAQVRFDILKDCLPLPESAFKHVIEDNYQGGSKFRQELSDEQVDNLITLFRPISVPPSAHASPLCPNVVSKHNSLPPIIEESVQLPANLHPPGGQHVGGLQLTGAGLALVSKHIKQATPPPGYERHYTSAHMMSVEPGCSQPYSESYYTEEANQPYCFENPSVHDPYGRYSNVPKNGVQITPQSTATQEYYCYNAPTQTHATMSSQVPGSQSTAIQDYYYYNTPTQAHAAVSSQVPATSHNSGHLPSSYLLAAYWAAVASEASDQVGSAPHMRPPSGSTGWAGDNVTVSHVGANALHFPSSMSAPYWAAVAAEVPNQVYSSQRGVPQGENSFGGEVGNAQCPMLSHQSASLPSSSQPSVYQAAVQDAMYYNCYQMRPS